ncbi:MAG: 7-carboxy-7-deazaguanine synthase QueE [Planctomycetes bacterium]|nr:7-carboxy-7-deazaguanine synthase QueE [Planctomycetota bacterium]
MTHETRPTSLTLPISSREAFILSEVFYSIQGEGMLAGAPSAFIRYCGCNLRCRWCDTPGTSWSPSGRTWSLAEILDRLGTYPTRYAVVTGGEPFLFKNLALLTETLAAAGYHVTVETAGTEFQSIRCDLLSLSPKLAHSTPRDVEGGREAEMHEKRRLQLPVLRSLLRAHEYQLKFVIDAPGDIEEVEGILRDLDAGVPREKVLLMPQGTAREELEARSAWLHPLCLSKGFRFCPRLHIEMFGLRPGT